MSPQSGRPVVDVSDAYCLLELDGGAVAALRGIDLHVSDGERVVVQGPNGSGKTTLLRVLIGEQRLAAGEAHVAGWPVGRGTRRGLAQWRARHVGWVDQHTGRTLRPELDVLDNVALQVQLNGTPRVTARALAIRALELVGAAELANRRIGTLSGGEGQRVAVAAALAHRPRVVFADEPAGQLDAEAAEIVYTTLAEAVSGVGAALVLVSHDRRACRVGDRVVRIRDGRASETWRPDEPGEEMLVVDRRGWVRLPAEARRDAGLGEVVRLDVVDGGAVLRDAVPDPDSLFRRPPVSPASDRAVAATVDHSPRTPPEQLIVARGNGVVRRFGEREVLRGVDVAFARGTLHVVHGRSGSGKSTLLRILVGLDDPDVGSVELIGTHLAGIDREHRARLRRDAVGMVLQEIHLDETATLLDNLDLARAVRHLPADRDADRRLLDRFGLAELADRQARHCSGGERQRAAIARAIVGSPSLVVLDEPTSQLDDASAARTIDALRAVAAAGTAVVVASHDPALVDAAGRRLDLDRPSSADR